MLLISAIKTRRGSNGSRGQSVYYDSYYEQCERALFALINFMPIYKERRDELENQLNRGALWAVTYGDLMSYLMIFFLMLFVFSTMKNNKTKNRKYEESLSNIQKSFGGKANEKQVKLAKAKENEEFVSLKLRQNKALSDSVQIQSSEQKLKLVLTDGILFDSGKAKLKQHAKNVLQTIVLELKKLPNDIIVEGYTDNVPIRGGKYSSNWELSMARAYNVVRYMEEVGIEVRRLAGMGYGENRPLADNSTAKGRSKNRRIEISLIKSE